MSIRRRICAPPVPKLPSGLVELMDGLARDVLKNNPENIYEFCAQHMQKLLELRDGHAPKSFITLDQKITKAQKKVNERAEQRRHAYDNKLRSGTCDVDMKEGILESSDIPPDGVDVLKSSENKEDENLEKDIDEENNKQEIVSNKVEKDSAIFATENTKDTKEENVANNQEALEINLTKNDSQQTQGNNDFTEPNSNTNDGTEKSTPEKNIASHENQPIAIDSNAQNLDNVLTESVSQNLNNIIIDSDAQNLNTITDSDAQNLNNIATDSNTQSLDTITDSDAQNLDKNTTFINSEINEDKFNTEVETEIQLQKNGTANNSAMITNIEIVENMNDEALSKNDIEENEVLPIIITDFENASDMKDESLGNKNSTELEIQEDSSVVSVNLQNQHSNEKVFSDEIKKNSVEIHIEDDTQEEDNKILAVILSKCDEPDISNQNQETNLGLSSELEQKMNEVSGSENASESTNDKTHSHGSMDLETAAITIQKVFRSFLFKTKTASYDDSTTIDMNLLNEDRDKEENDSLNKPIKDRRPLGISRMDTVLQTVNEEKSLSLSTDDSSTISSAATIIQAHVRGFLARNKFNLNKTISTNSCIDSDAPSIPSLEADSDNRKSKTVLNIHIVPEGGHFISRDESIITSMDLSLDNSPPSSVNLHPLGYDKSERRKQLKREDAIQSVSPPSNNSGKLSDDVDSVKEILAVEGNNSQGQPILDEKSTGNFASDISNKADVHINNKEHSKVEIPAPDVASDEMDVITPFVPIEEKSSRESDNASKLLHSGEFHDIVLPTNVSRSDTSVVREFQNVLVYFILWNN